MIDKAISLAQQYLYVPAPLLRPRDVLDIGLRQGTRIRRPASIRVAPSARIRIFTIRHWSVR